MVQDHLIRIEGKAVELRYARVTDLDAYFAFLQDVEMLRLTGSQGILPGKVRKFGCKRSARRMRTGST